MTDNRATTAATGAVSGLGETGKTLDESELRFRALVAARSTAIYRMSPDWQEMRELTGQGFLEDTNQPNGSWLDKYILPEDRLRVLAAIASAMESHTVFELEHRARLPDGRIGWTQSRAVPIVNASGDLVEWFGAATDVTQQHQAAERLRESEAGFKAIANLVPELVWVTDHNGQLVFFNQRWSDYFGPDGDQENARLLAAACIHPDDVAKTLQAFDSARACAGVFEVEHRLRGQDGTYRWFMARANPYRDPDSGEVLRWYGTSVDVHSRHQAEEQLRHFNDQLEVQVQTGSQDLLAAEAQVRQMQKLEAIGQLTGGVAHDFNNLLTIIRNSAELLRRRELPPQKQHHYLDAILDTTDRAAKLTGQLLAFARRQPLKPEVFNVAERVEHIADMLRRMIGARTTIVVRPPDQPCFVRVDLNQFETALMNLVINARDAMRSHGVVTVTIAALRPPQPSDSPETQNGQVSVAVADEGYGIAPAALERIFEPFYTTKEVGKGTGLGLSQVYGFVRQSGGDVRVQSTVGKGTTFTVSLPAVEVAGAPMAQQPSVDGVRHKARILVVEDNAQVGEFTAKLLEDPGYETALAEDASSALTVLERQQERVDLVLSDIVMPGINGIELARTVRQRWPALPVILTSGYSQALAGEQRHGFELLRKPYSVVQMLAAVEGALKD